MKKTLSLFAFATIGSAFAYSLGPGLSGLFGIGSEPVEVEFGDHEYGPVREPSRAAFPCPKDAKLESEFFAEIAAPFYRKHIVETYDAAAETNEAVRTRVLKVREELARHLTVQDLSFPRQEALDAANEVIRHNTGRKGKTLWTDVGAGDRVLIKTVFNEQDEANFVVSSIMMDYNRGRNWKDNVILYRMNAQSNALEYAFKRNGVPYQVIGGTKFFERAEVKDMLAYLAVINNPSDDLRLRRIINNPPRGIGAKSIETVQVLAQEQSMPMMERMSITTGSRASISHLRRRESSPKRLSPTPRQDLPGCCPNGVLTGRTVPC